MDHQSEQGADVGIVLLIDGTGSQFLKNSSHFGEQPGLRLVEWKFPLFALDGQRDGDVSVFLQQGFLQVWPESAEPNDPLGDLSTVLAASSGRRCRPALVSAEVSSQSYPGRRYLSSRSRTT